MCNVLLTAKQPMMMNKYNKYPFGDEQTQQGQRGDH